MGQRRREAGKKQKQKEEEEEEEEKKWNCIYSMRPQSAVLVMNMIMYSDKHEVRPGCQ